MSHRPCVICYHLMVNKDVYLQAQRPETWGEKHAQRYVKKLYEEDFSAFHLDLNNSQETHHANNVLFPNFSACLFKQRLKMYIHFYASKMLEATQPFVAQILLTFRHAECQQDLGTCYTCENSSSETAKLMISAGFDFLLSCTMPAWPIHIRMRGHQSSGQQTMHGRQTSGRQTGRQPTERLILVN